MHIATGSPFAFQAESRVPSTIQDAFTYWSGTWEHMQDANGAVQMNPLPVGGILASPPGHALLLRSPSSEHSLRFEPARAHDRVSTLPVRAYVYADELEGARHRHADGARWVEESAWCS